MKIRQALKFTGLVVGIGLLLHSCGSFVKQGNLASTPVLKNFVKETGIQARYLLDTALLNSVRSWQGKGEYPGTDNWTTAKIPNTADLYGGLPGQSEYYTLASTIRDTDTLQKPYWESLQVKENVKYGYRPMVGVFHIKPDSIVVAISKVEANKQYGRGGAWQLYVANYKSELQVLDTIYLKK